MDPSVLALLTEPPPKELKAKEQISQLRLMGARLRYKKTLKAIRKKNTALLVKYLHLPLSTIINNNLPRFSNLFRDLRPHLGIYTTNGLQNYAIAFPGTLCVSCKHYHQGRTNTPLAYICNSCSPADLAKTKRPEYQKIFEDLTGFNNHWLRHMDKQYIIELFNAVEEYQEWIS